MLLHRDKGKNKDYYYYYYYNLVQDFFMMSDKIFDNIIQELGNTWSEFDDNFTILINLIMTTII